MTRALDLAFATTRDEARAWMTGAQAASRLFEEGRPLPVGDVSDVTAALERARVGGVLAPDELVAVGRMLLASARALRRFLASRKAELPALFAACSTDPTLDDLADEIAGSLTPTERSPTRDASPARAAGQNTRRRDSGCSRA